MDSEHRRGQPFGQNGLGAREGCDFCVFELLPATFHPKTPNRHPKGTPNQHPGAPKGPQKIKLGRKATPHGSIYTEVATSYCTTNKANIIYHILNSRIRRCAAVPAQRLQSAAHPKLVSRGVWNPPHTLSWCREAYGIQY